MASRKQALVGRENGVLFAMLMPHAPVLVPAVGGLRLGEVKSTVHAMREAARRMVAAQPDSLIVVTPHSPRRPGAFGIWSASTLQGSLMQFGAPEVSVSLPSDLALAEAIAREAALRGIAAWQISGQSLDHGAVVPLWFLVDAGWRGPTVVLGLNQPGGGDLGTLGHAISAAARSIGRRFAFLASGDLSHRLRAGAPAGFHPQAVEFDRAFIATIRRGAYRKLLSLDSELQDLAAEDAADSTIIGAAAASWNADGHEVLSYESPFGVGYGVAVLYARQPAR